MTAISKVLTALVAVLAMATSARAAPLEAYGKLPTVESVAISPSGSQLAIVTTDGEERTILIQDVAAGTVTFRTRTDAVKVRALRWAGERHLVITAGVTARPKDVITTQREWLIAFSLNLATRKLTPLLRNVDGAMNTIDALPSVRTVSGAPTVFLQGVAFRDGFGRRGLFRARLDRESAQILETGLPETRDWVVSPDGEAMAQELFDPKTDRWSIRMKGPGGWRDLIAAKIKKDDGPRGLLGLAPDGRSVVYRVPDPDKRDAWYTASLDEAQVQQSVLVPGNVRPVFDPQDDKVVGHFALDGDSQTYTFFDPADAKAWRMVLAAFRGSIVDLISWSSDHQKIVVRVDSPAEGPAYAMVDVASRKATWLGAEYAGVSPTDVAPKTAIKFMAVDGMALTGYLTTPPGKVKTGLPLIVFPHGGPAVRDVPGFDWWAQGMAARGYAVLQVNYRGSDGFGKAHLEAGHGQWGRKMQTDLSDGVRWLATQGTIDPKRVCIVGASYGGYAALAGAAIDTGVYRCAASVAGISDLKRFVLWARDKSGSDAYQYWTKFMGVETARDEALAQVSPIENVGKISIPVLLLHGRDDTVVTFDQSQIMADALRKAGKPVELILMKGEDHWLSRGETRLQTLTATMAFVEKHNPPN